MKSRLIGMKTQEEDDKERQSIRTAHFLSGSFFVLLLYFVNLEVHCPILERQVSYCIIVHTFCFVGITVFVALVVWNILEKDSYVCNMTKTFFIIFQSNFAIASYY